MTEFLRVPSLRCVEFRDSCFTSSLCQAIAMAWRQGSSITSLALHRCSFPEGGSENIASAIKENATLTTFKIFSHEGFIPQAFYNAMAASLLSNSTLQELSVVCGGAGYSDRVSVSSLILALGMNQTLRKLYVSGFSSAGGSLIPALREGLEKKSTLEMLELIQGFNWDDTHLNSLHIAVVEALQLNKTLKTLRLSYGTSTLTNDQAQHLISVAKKNYGLESIPIFDLESRMEDLRSILRLNGAGRGYLLDGQGSVVSKESVY